MKRKLLTLVGLSVTLLLTAAPITKETARKKALQFLTERGDNVAASRGAQSLEMQLRDGADVEKLHVFNVGQKEGFVIISGDDCTGDLILGYADRGEISTNNIPDNLRAWLQGYSDQISWMQQHGIKNEVAASRALTGSSVRKPVSPVMATLWNQGEPYSNYCPKMDSDGSIGTVTGCVATAAAQVMLYQAKKNNIPSTLTTVIPGYANNTGYWWYIDGNQASRMPQKPAITINWEEIPLEAEPSTSDAIEQVAHLMEYVGAGVKMQYDSGGSQSSSSDIPYMLKTYFGYDANVQCVERNNYTYSDWLNLIYQELTTNGPVLYSGQSTGGGHSFVLDGYSDEDYFYVNWGWGGMSNGYFKLSVMHSDHQGIGGSTSQDGYSYQQDAIIGVNPINSGIDISTRLTVSNAWPETVTHTRKSGNQDFSNVVLHSAMMNKTSTTQSFDFGFALYQDGVFKQILWQESVDNLHNNSGWSDYAIPSSFGAGLEDGIYQCVPVSRKKNSETWYPDFNSEAFYIKATVKGNTLTLEVNSIVNLLATSFTVSDSPTAGQPVTVRTTIQNNGTLYYGDLSLGYDYGGYQLLATQQIEMEAGKTSTIDFTFTPDFSGSLTLQVTDKNKKVIGSQNITISNGGLPSSSLTETTTVIHNGELTNSYFSGSYAIYGNTIMATVSIRNNDSYANAEGIRLAVYDLTAGRWVDDLEKIVPAVIPANSVLEIDYDISGFESDHYYQIYYCYVNGSNIKNTGNELSGTNVFYTIPGITTYDVTGAVSSIKMGDGKITIADNTLAAVDITGCGKKAVIPNSNPNTIYIIGSADNPSGLNGKNVVKGGVATTLTISDDYDFYTPIDFTATTATYTRKFTVGANGTGGWSTIVLPFEVSTVKQGGKTINWFHNSSDTGDFWLKEFVYEDGGTVYFDFADNLYANTPYIIAVPGNKWGDQYDLTNKDITFYGSNVTIPATGNSSVSGNNYKFDGTTVSKTVTDSYLLNSAGENFVLGDGTLQPFRACFKGVKMLVGSSKLAIASANSSVTAISEGGHVKSGSDNRYYNLQGQRVNQPRRGMYIVDGKKIIVK